MKIKGIAGMLLITVLISCSSSKPGLLSGQQKAKAIDSLLLVRSLPITISATSPSFKKEIRVLLGDSLKAKKYKCLNEMEALALYNEKREELIRSNKKENNTGPPYMQSL